MNKTYLITIILLIVVGVAGFFAGTKFQQSKSPVGRFGNVQGARNGNQRMGIRPVNGEIISADEKTITVKLQDGSSKIVLLTDTTQINKSTDAAKTDLKTGEKVAVFGTENSDGSVTAQNISLNTILRNIPSQQ